VNADLPTTTTNKPLLVMTPQIPKTDPVSPIPQSPPAILNSIAPSAFLACVDKSATVPDTIASTQLPVAASQRRARRNGRVACLPRPQRDMVNRMLWNSVPYKNIVAALNEVGFSGISERNISNWFSGGYLEWSLAQEQDGENRLQQDHLLDFLRRDDAPDLPEVGLQAAATRLSQVFLQKLAQADDPETHLDSYSKLVELLCRLNREIAATQQQRDQSHRNLGRHADPDRIRSCDELQAISDEKFFSDPPPDSGLQKAPVTPFLPPEPTSELLERHDREAEQERRDNNLALLRSMTGVPIQNRLPSKTHPATASPPKSPA
jgi:hypothetical protein